MNEAKFEALAREAGKIFTPTSPVDETSLFAGRRDQVRSVIDVINQRGQHGILYGERGVGKTSLVNLLAGFLGVPSIIAPRVNCDSTDTYASVWTKAFSLVPAEVSRPEIGFTGQRVTTPVSGIELLPQPVTPDSVRAALSKLSGVTAVFIIDEFDRLPEEVRRAFADTIKTLSDHAVPATVLLAGR